MSLEKCPVCGRHTIEPKRVGLLRIFVDTLGKRDAPTINNAVFVAQKLLNLQPMYIDFEKLENPGVASADLGNDLSTIEEIGAALPKTLNGLFKEHVIQPEEQARVKKAAEQLAHITEEELRRLADRAFYGNNIAGDVADKTEKLWQFSPAPG